MWEGKVMRMNESYFTHSHPFVFISCSGLRDAALQRDDFLMF
jgi:hypothetical protein